MLFIYHILKSFTNRINLKNCCSNKIHVNAQSIPKRVISPSQPLESIQRRVEWNSCNAFIMQSILFDYHFLLKSLEWSMLNWARNLFSIMPWRFAMENRTNKNTCRNAMIMEHHFLAVLCECSRLCSCFFTHQ